MWGNLNFVFTTTSNISRDSLVRLVTKLNAGRNRNRGSVLGRDKKVFSSLTPVYKSMGKTGVFPGVKQKRNGSYHSHTSACSTKGMRGAL